MAKSGTKYLALLRGINVGGKNIIAKEELKACFESCGFSNVKTYIQSGNILFRSEKSAIKKLTQQIESALQQQFNYDAQAVILSQPQYKKAVAAIPKGWGEDENRKHNAIFVLNQAKPAVLLALLPDPKPKIETVTPGPGVIFWSVSKEHATKTTMLKLSKSPVYQKVTVRNHNTFHKLHALFDTI